MYQLYMYSPFIKGCKRAIKTYPTR